MFCVECGNQFEGKFCPECGTPVNGGGNIVAPEPTGVKCPKCKGVNVSITMEAVNEKTTKKKNSLIRSAARGTMILGTGGLWALTPKHDGKEKTTRDMKKYAICQSCGHSWELK